MNKRMPKKLSLCTETLRNLNEQDLRNAAGGSLVLSNCAACGTNTTATNLCSGCKPCD